MKESCNKLHQAIDDYFDFNSDDHMDTSMLFKAIRFAIEIIEQNNQLSGSERKEIVMHVFTEIIYDRIADETIARFYINMLDPIVDSIVDAGNYLHLNKNQRKCLKKYCF